MKKLTLALVIALVTSGAVWAQPTPPAPGEVLGGIFDQFNAVPTMSTEARYSGGIFGSMVDDYISVNYYDSKVGTFLFTGGYPSGSSVEDTAYPTYALNLGLGKTLKNSYLGLYYGGSFFSAEGNNDGGSPATKTSARVWANNVALLLGTSNFGAFRLDLIINTISAEFPSGTTTVKGYINAPSFALTWGMPSSLHPYIKVGYKLPDKIVLNLPPDFTARVNSRIGVQAGLNYDLNDTSSVSGDIVIGGQLGSTGKILGEKIRLGGVFATGLRGAYKKTFDFGKFSMGFQPNVAFGLAVDNSDDLKKPTKVDYPAELDFEFRAGVNFGIKFRPTQKFAFFTGASLNLFDLRTISYAGGDTKNDSSAWDIDGFYFNDSYLTSKGRLGFGMTFEPIRNLVIGAGLNGFLDRFFAFNLSKMRVENDMENSSNFLYAIFNGMTFDLTISYKF